MIEVQTWDPWKIVQCDNNLGPPSVLSPFCQVVFITKKRGLTHLFFPIFMACNNATLIMRHNAIYHMTSNVVSPSQNISKWFNA
jgi:hypothetical protein